MTIRKMIEVGFKYGEPVQIRRSMYIMRFNLGLNHQGCYELVNEITPLEFADFDELIRDATLDSEFGGTPY